MNQVKPEQKTKEQKEVENRTPVQPEERRGEALEDDTRDDEDTTAVTAEQRPPSDS